MVWGGQRATLVNSVELTSLGSISVTTNSRGPEHSRQQPAYKTLSHFKRYVHNVYDQHSLGCKLILMKFNYSRFIIVNFMNYPSIYLSLNLICQTETNI